MLTSLPENDPSVYYNLRMTMAARKTVLLLLVAQIYVGEYARAFIVELPSLKTRDAKITVRAPAGEIVGFEDSVNVRSKLVPLRKFLGIPYAEPPVGQRRFAKPVLKAKFAAPHTATSYGPACFQISINSALPVGNYSYSEDCLFLNVIAPERPVGGGKIPVMIWIHGGGFTAGSSMDNDVDYFSAFGDVIVVTVNYRLAQLGFLGTADGVIPGNFGLWDQQLAIQWVHKNIGAFGGDAKRVTVFGESAGAISVVFHAIYPGNQGLIQRVIAESGTVVAAWSLQQKAMVDVNAKSFADALGCNQTTTTDMLKCLRGLSGDVINVTMNTPTKSYQSWGPLMDNDFVVDDPVRIMNGSTSVAGAAAMFACVDLVIGCNSRDGVVDLYTWMALLHEYDFSKFSVSRTQYEQILIPHFLQFYYQTQIPPSVTHLGVFEYTDWSDPDDDAKRLNQLANIASDVLFYVPSTRTADAHAKTSNGSTYMYRFSVKLHHHFFLFPPALEAPDAANHMDELGFLFKGPDEDDSEKQAHAMNMTIQELSTFLRVSREMITMWTNFAKSGNPNQPADITSYGNSLWPEYTKDEGFLNIRPEAATPEQLYAPEALEFFESIVPEMLNKS